MQVWKFKVKVPKLGWIPVSAFGKSREEARKTIEERYPGNEGIE